ncbi:hypothetical protein YT1_5469 [Rhodococcus ruber]|nr:hypothetical protein YT1_5469 [Rhodococcus ruber]
MRRGARPRRGADSPWCAGHRPLLRTDGAVAGAGVVVGRVENH